MPASDVEAKVHDVTLAHDVLLALKAQFAGFLCPRLSTISHIIIERDHLGADEAALEVRMNHSRRLWRGRTGTHRPCTHLLRSRGKVSLKAKQAVAGTNHAIEPGFAQLELLQKFGAIGLLEL